MADKSAYVPPEALSGSSGGIKKDTSDVDLDDVDFFAKPTPAKKPPTPAPVVLPPPPPPIKPHHTPEPPAKKPVIVYKKSTTYQKTFAGQK
uniref:Calpain inhibitor n=1 Tax=Parastrongyloides trichosuri TaxID=131310 RepID=A0A0N4Z3I4_PARTI